MPSVSSSLWIVTVTLLVTGCRFSWEADVDTDCAEFRTWYRDADGDRWGTLGDSQDACAPAGEYTSRNDRDCDDGDPLVTGRVGSLCPAQLVHAREAATVVPTQYAGVTVGPSELVVVQGSTELVWASAAESACGSMGWGGQLASLSDPASIVQALDTVASSQVYWAGYVGVVFNPDAPFPQGSQTGDPPPVSGQWQFLNGDAVPETRLCSFNGSHGADSGDYDPALGFLALVKDRLPLQGDGSSSDYCFGTPNQARPPGECGSAARPCYSNRFAHFMCSRAVPDPSAYAL